MSRTGTKPDPSHPRRFRQNRQTEAASLRRARAVGRTPVHADCIAVVIRHTTHIPPAAGNPKAGHEARPLCPAEIWEMRLPHESRDFGAMTGSVFFGAASPNGSAVLPPVVCSFVHFDEAHRAADRAGIPFRAGPARILPHFALRKRRPCATMQGNAL